MPPRRQGDTLKPYGSKKNPGSGWRDWPTRWLARQMKKAARFLGRQEAQDPEERMRRIHGLLVDNATLQAEPETYKELMELTGPTQESMTAMRDRLDRAPLRAQAVKVWRHPEEHKEFMELLDYGSVDTLTPPSAVLGSDHETPSAETPQPADGADDGPQSLNPPSGPKGPPR